MSVFHVEGKLKCTRAAQIVCNYPIYAVCASDAFAESPAFLFLCEHVQRVA